MTNLGKKERKQKWTRTTTGSDSDWKRSNIEGTSAAVEKDK